MKNSRGKNLRRAEKHLKRLEERHARPRRINRQQSRVNNLKRDLDKRNEDQRTPQTT